MYNNNQDTIVALATASGIGAIAVIRLSGNDAIKIVSRIFKSSNKKQLENQKSHTVHFGTLQDNERLIDEVLVSIFKSPRSYTGENVVEISCHGSPYIQQEIIKLMLKEGCRMAQPGEFTLRAFLSGKMNLSQAEAVADLIASNSLASHQVAMQQMRDGFGTDIKKLRSELIHFASMVELELDFAEEDVEFANKEQFLKLLDRITLLLQKLISSFAVGNAMKNGIPIAIIGKPNVGKSTLLNALLNEEKAIVSEIAGTTRDAIEDQISIGGIIFRFIDTAGIRQTDDIVEKIGIQKTFQKIDQAQGIMYLFDVSDIQSYDLVINEIKELKDKFPKKDFLILANKSDTLGHSENKNKLQKIDIQYISAKEKQGLEHITQWLHHIASQHTSEESAIISNMRHFEAMNKALKATHKVKEGLNSNLSGELLAIDIGEALHFMGLVSGEVTNEDLLDNIFRNFCIGK